MAAPDRSDYRREDRCPNGSAKLYPMTPRPAQQINRRFALRLD